MEYPKIAELRDLSTPLLQFFVVMPDGHIKRCLFERNISCPMLIVTFRKNEKTGRPEALEDVTVHPSYAKAGWVALEDLYRQEDRLEDFASYVKWSDHANSTPGTEPLDDAYLPDEVLRRRATWKKEQRKVKLAPPKARKPKAEKDAK